MRKIIINEAQKKRLFEAYSEGFSLENLSLIGHGQFSLQDNSEVQVKYCEEYLGPMQDYGTSRCTFTINDGMILKLAYNGQGLWEAGIEQNKAEYELYSKADSPILPRIFYHDDDFQFIVCESIIPATETDFEQFLGASFYGTYKQHTIKEPMKGANGDATVGFDKYFSNLKGYKETDYHLPLYKLLRYIQTKYSQGKECSVEWCDEIIANSWWLQELVRLCELGMCDILSLSNYGIVNRDGNPLIVVLDSGLNHDVATKYYDY